MAGAKEQSVTRTPQSSEFESWLKEVARADPVEQADLIDVGVTLADGRFEVTDLLGRGGMGSVYRAWDARDGRAVALKTLRGRRPERLYRLKREFRALADVRHRNLVKLWELHRDGDRWFFTMELIVGENVKRHSQGRGADRARDVVGQLAAGLAMLHSEGLVHRDVKPSNTLVDASGRVVLLDFGLIADVAHGVHLPGAVLGTEAYMAPEQAAGQEPTAAADLYSLGMILYELLVGELPKSDPALERIDDDELRELCAVLLGPALTRPSAASVAARLGVSAPPLSRARAPLVGREAQLETLLAELDRVAQEGRSRVVELLGDAGLGKTALLAKFCERARRQGLLVLSGRCREREQVPFNALDSIIDDVVDILREATFAGDEANLGSLARLFPAMGAVSKLAVAPALSSTPSVERRRAFAGLAEMLAAAAGGRPLCLAIDDAQWADNDSAALLTSLLACRDLALMVVLVTTTERRVSERLGAPIAVLELDRLTDRQSCELAMLLLEEPTFDRARAIAREAQGMPLFIRELTRAEQPSKDAELDTLFAARIGKLDAVAADALALISVSSSALTREMVHHAVENPDVHGADAIDRLERGHLVRASRRRGQSVLEPYHPRIQDTVCLEVSAAELRALHRRVALAIEAVAPDDAMALLVHWRQAGEIERAKQCALDAAHAAHASLAFDRASELISTAIELGVNPTVELLVLHAEALEGAGRGARAADTYLEAARMLARRDRDEPFETVAFEIRKLERRAAEQLLRAGHIDDGIDLISKLLAAEGMRLPTSPLLSLIQLGIERVRLLGKRRQSNKGELRRLEATWALAVGLSQVDPVRGALYQARHLRLALASGDSTRIALGLCADAMSAAAAGPPARHAYKLLREAAATGASSDDPRVPAYLALAEAEVGFLCGEFGGAREHAREANRRFQACVNARWEQATAKLFYLTCLWHTGRLSALRAEAREAAQEARALGDRYALTQLQTTVLPPMHLLADDSARARADLDEALAAWSRREMFLQHWQHLQATALVELYDGAPERALEAFTTRFTGTGKLILSQVKAVRVFTAYVRGIAAVGALARRPRDRDYARSVKRDIRRLRREGRTAATVALIEAQLHHIRGEKRQALSALTAGVRAAADRDLLLIAACGRACLARLGDDVAAAQARHFFSSQPVARPDRIIAMFMPAFSDLPDEMTDNDGRG